MGGYENGISTRKMILNVCQKLFYEKGYHETSYDDICKAAHVNRGSIYYHFKEKANIRYEVLWEMTKRCCDIAKEYCDKHEFVFFMGTYIFWGKTLADAKLRRFLLSYYEDYPVYTPNNPVAQYYKICNKNMYGSVWDVEKIEPLPFATVYSNIHGIMRLIDENPQHYSLEELYRHLIMSGIMIWGIPKEKAVPLWENEIKTYMAKIPKEILESPWMV